VHQSTPDGCGAAASHYTKIRRSQFYNYLSQLSTPKSAAVSITLKSAQVTTPKSAQVSSIFIFSRYNVANIQRMPQVAGHFQQNPLIIGLFRGK